MSGCDVQVHGVCLPLAIEWLARLLYAAPVVFVKVLAVVF